MRLKETMVLTVSLYPQRINVRHLFMLETFIIIYFEILWPNSIVIILEA